MKPELEEKVKRDSRSKLIDDALIDKLRTEYSVETTDGCFRLFCVYFK